MGDLATSNQLSQSIEMSKHNSSVLAEDEYDGSSGLQDSEEPVDQLPPALSDGRSIFQFNFGHRGSVSSDLSNPSSIISEC